MTILLEKRINMTTVKNLSTVTVETNIIMKSTAKLNEEVLDELHIPDPDVESAEAILKKAKDKEEVGQDEDSEGNDRGRSNTDNPEDSE